MADSSARVQAISIIRDFRGRLVEFTDVVREALAEADHDIRRTIDWLQHEQRMRWQHEIKKTSKLLENARSELFRAELNAQQTGGSTRDERARVTQLQRRIEHAETKLRAIDRWLKQLEREMTVYRGHVNALSTAVSADLPAAGEQLKAIADQLDRYVATTLPGRDRTSTDDDATAAGETDDDGDDKQS